MYKFERSFGLLGGYLLRKTLFFLGEMEACEVVDKGTGRSAGRWVAYSNKTERLTFSPMADNPDWQKLTRALEDENTLLASEIVWGLLGR